MNDFRCELGFKALIEHNNQVVIDFDDSNIYTKFDESTQTTYICITDKEEKNEYKITIKKY